MITHYRTTADGSSEAKRTSRSDLPPSSIPSQWATILAGRLRRRGDPPDAERSAPRFVLRQSRTSRRIAVIGLVSHHPLGCSSRTHASNVASTSVTSCLGLGRCRRPRRDGRP